MSDSIPSSAAPATIIGGGSNLSEYRALQQVLGFAAHKRHDAADVVTDAFIGGVVSAFCDQCARTPSQVLLPSSRCVAVMAPLIAEGFFSPSLSFTLDNPFSTPYQPLTESNGRDTFTLVYALFPDCFIDVPLSATIDERTGSAVVERSNSQASAPVDEDRLHRATPAPTDPVASLTAFVTPVLSRSTSPSVPIQLPTTLTTATTSNTTAANPELISSMLSHTQETSRGASNAPNNNNNSSSVAPGGGASLANTLSLVPPSNAVVSAASSSPPTPVDLAQMHRARQCIALTYLNMINDTLRDVQVRELLLEKRRPTAATSATTAEPKAAPLAPAERANVRAVGSASEKLKALLLCCMCATEMAYRPLTREEAGGCLVEPKQVLLDKLDGSEFFKAVEDWSVWKATVEEAAAWYDQRVERLCTEFSASGCGDFGSFLNTLTAESLQGCARAVTRAPEPLLYRATDGHSGVSMATLPHLFSQPPVPIMPIGPGEAMLLFSANNLELLFDSKPSPLLPTLTRWAQRKLTDAQVKDESRAFFDNGELSIVPAWVDLSSVAQQAVLEGFVRDTDMLTRVLQLNPVLLAHVAMWMGGTFGRPARATPAISLTDGGQSASCDDKADTTKAIVEEVLLRQSFSVSTGYFMRELVSHKALHEPIFYQWLGAVLDKLQNHDADVAPHTRTVLTLIDFVLASSQWKPEKTLLDRLTEIKRRR